MDKMDKIQVYETATHNDLSSFQELSKPFELTKVVLDDLKREYERCVDLEQKTRVAKLIARFSLDLRKIIRFQHDLMNNYVKRSIENFGGKL